MRGNRASRLESTGGLRSIPACAGEPRRYIPSGGGNEVYPRVCGGTRLTQHVNRRALGLSPRVRGNRYSWRCWPLRGGSIPACAGEPESISVRYCQVWVYPRVCGGTLDPGGRGRRASGLSPRVRGNRWRHWRYVGEWGSIPACAGEPPQTPPWPQPSTVYPRVCGGTLCPVLSHSAAYGLSPRVRGNPV